MTYRLPRDPVGIRTPNLRIRSAMLYPVELQSHHRRRRVVQTGGKDTNSNPTTKPFMIFLFSLPGTTGPWPCAALWAAPLHAP